MNKLAFYRAYMDKDAASATDSILREVVKYPSILGAPIIAGYAGGRGYANLKEPTKEEVSKIQAAYVRKKLTQAIEDLEKRRKIENLQEQFGGKRNTLRI